MILEGLGEHFGFIDESLNPDLDDIQQNYIAPGHVFLVAVERRSVVGTAGLLFERPGEARIVRMSVQASHRRRGVASLLLTALIEEAQSRSLGMLIAHTEPHWADATSFYSKSGFRQFSEDHVDIHLRRALEPAG